jgi:serine/threonine-protein kinase
MVQGQLEKRWLGRVVDGRFRILDLLGSGGMGAVFLAEQLDVGRRAVVKLMAPDQLHGRVSAARFRREAHAIAKLNHPNIVQVFLSGAADDDHFYLAMEYVDGCTLREELRRAAPFEPARALWISQQLTAALSTAHAAGVVHRDLKPENIMLTARPGETDVVKVLDFGLAKMVGLDAPDTHITTPGTIFGTPAYMSPEQVRAETVDARADIYSTGLILYEMLTGQHPFDANTPISYFMKHVGEAARPVSEHAFRPDVNPEIDDLVARCLRKSPERRFQSAEALRRAIRDARRALTEAPGWHVSSRPTPPTATWPAETPPPDFESDDAERPPAIGADTVPSEAPSEPAPPQTGPSAESRVSPRSLVAIALIVLLASSAGVLLAERMRRPDSATGGAAGLVGAAAEAPDSAGEAIQEPAAGIAEQGASGPAEPGEEGAAISGPSAGGDLEEASPDESGAGGSVTSGGEDVEPAPTPAPSFEDAYLIGLFANPWSGLPPERLALPTFQTDGPWDTPRLTPSIEIQGLPGRFRTFRTPLPFKTVRDLYAERYAREPGCVVPWPDSPTVLTAECQRPDATVLLYVMAEPMAELGGTRIGYAWQAATTGSEPARTCDGPEGCPPELVGACDGPEDCPPDQHCVISALGEVGCEPGDACCGADECYDGCHVDADCPTCRPVCRGATADRGGSCRRE